MVDIFDVLALVFGVLFSIRKLEVRRTGQPPDLAPEKFEQWQTQALAAYSIGTLACFGWVVLDNGLPFVAGPLGVPGGALRALHFALFFALIAGVVTCFVLGSKARRLAQTLGIETLRQAPPAKPADPDDAPPPDSR